MRYIRKISWPGGFISPAVVLVLLLASCTSFVPQLARRQSAPLEQPRLLYGVYSEYINSKFYNTTLVPIDMRTMAPEATSKWRSLPYQSYPIVSGNGRVLVNSPGASGTVYVYDASSGKQRRFKVPDGAWLDQLTRDGSRLLLQQDLSDVDHTLRFFVYDTHTGRRISQARVTASPQGYINGMLMDARGRYGYLLMNSSGARKGPRVLKFDLNTGRIVASVKLRDVYAGTWEIINSRFHDASDPVFAQWSPGFALSPDGLTLAVMDGRASNLILVDTRNLHRESTRKVAEDTGFLSRFFEGLVPAAEAKGMIGVSLGIIFSPDGKYLYEYGTRGEVNPDYVPPTPCFAREACPATPTSPFTVQNLGVKRISVRNGKVVASARTDHILTFPKMAADGNSVYILEGTTNGDASICKCKLVKLDAATFNVAASHRSRYYDSFLFVARDLPPKLSSKPLRSR